MQARRLLWRLPPPPPQARASGLILGQCMFRERRGGWLFYAFNTLIPRQRARLPRPLSFFTYVLSDFSLYESNSLIIIIVFSGFAPL